VTPLVNTKVKDFWLGPSDTRNHIFVLLDRAAGIIVPKRSFVSPQDCEGFLAALRQHAGM
jgi:hypothetical protein